MDTEVNGNDVEAKEPLPASQKYLDMIKEGERAFSEYNTRVDGIDKRYASLASMAKTIGDREFKIFWANLEVLKPTIYQRSPRPVVTPRHSDLGQVPKKASELLERVQEFDVEDDDLHETLLLVRDDLALGARGVPWVLDSGSCIHVNRRDFVHEPARKWSEVGFVARRAFMDRASFRDRFPDADHTKIKFEEWKGENDGEGAEYKSANKKAQVWELWSKSEQMVVWLVEGYDTVLDTSEPMINVKGFFPCPKPAYGTVERETLKPVPDYVYYRDQIDEINELTARISSLSESLRLKGFYASGASEVGEAIEAAMKATDNKAILVPISNFAALGGQGLKDAIVWLPLDQVAATVAACVELRKQLIEDVYEITGLSDIMRGQTAASETATAQNLKAQYGSVRVSDRQKEMVRVARDILRMKAEIFAETLTIQELMEQAQMPLPSMDELQQAQMQGQDVSKEVSAEQVDALLKNQRLRPFVLDVESDSTIAPNEEAEKASRIEFIGAVGGFIQQAGAMVVQQPETAGFAAEMLKFTANGFRAGRELSGAIDEFAERIKAMGDQAGQPQVDPAQQAQAQAIQMETQSKQADAQSKMQKTQADIAEMQRKSELETIRTQSELQMKAEEHQANMALIQANIALIEAKTAEVGKTDRVEGMQ